MEREKHTEKHSDTEDMGALGSGKQFGVSGMGCVCVCVCVCVSVCVSVCVNGIRQCQKQTGATVGQRKELTSSLKH